MNCHGLILDYSRKGELNNLIKTIDRYNINIKKSYSCDGALYWAASENHCHIIVYLIGNGVTEMKSGLEGACVGGHLDLVKFFISQKARLAVKHFRVAASFNHKVILDFLISTIPPEKLVSWLNEALYAAATENADMTVRFLLDSGAEEQYMHEVPALPPPKTCFLCKKTDQYSMEKHYGQCDKHKDKVFCDRCRRSVKYGNKHYKKCLGCISELNK